MAQGGEGPMGVAACGGKGGGMRWGKGLPQPRPIDADWAQQVLAECTAHAGRRHTQCGLQDVVHVLELLSAGQCGGA